MARLLPLAVAALSAVALSTTAGSALADAASGAAAPIFMGCQVAIGADGMTVPANAPALLVYDASNGATATVSADLVTTSGRTALGAPTKDANDLSILALPTPPVGSHTVVTKVACSNGTPDAEQETSITITAAVPLPTTVGTLTLRPNLTPTGTDRVVLEASPALVAFKSVAIVDVSIGDASPAFGSAKYPSGIPPELTINSGSVCVENGALIREKRTIKVTVSARLAGVANSPAPATLDIPVDCGAIRWTSDSDFDGSKTTEPSPQTPNGNGTNSNAVSSGASGCSAAPGSAGLLSGSSSVFLAAAVALLAGFRRRRQA
jgi:MYXO-CTERM domain-containing protein